MADQDQNAITEQKQPVTVDAKVPQKPVVDPDSPASSDQPYMTANTEKIAAKNAKAVKDVAYSYTANGYEVAQRKATEQEKGFADSDGFVYDVDGNELPLRTYGSKRDAEIFCESHSAAFALQHATMPSA